MRQIVVAALLALAACGPSPRGASHATVTDPGSEVVCQEERSTGTNMSRPVCYTREQVEENRKAAQDWEKRPRNDVNDRRAHP